MRILTYNIRGGRGMDERRELARIVGVIRENAPDFTCLQEVHQRVPWSFFADQPRQLEKSLGMTLVFQRNLTLGFGGEGVMIASKFPLLAVVRHRLPGGRERRGLLETRWKTPVGVITLFGTHWGLSERERARQAKETARIIRQTPGPLVVCGDFNERGESAALTEFLTQTGLRDAGARENCPTYPADAPRARIDFIFFSEHWRKIAVVTTQTTASDHCPVVADLESAGSGDDSGLESV